MASLISSPSFACPFLSKNKTKSSRKINLSCKASSDHEGRRNVLIGLAGTATALTKGSNPALASPIVTPESCHKTTGAKLPNQECCPPAPPTKLDIVDFEPPPCTGAPLRVRRPAHLADPEYVEKYEEAVRLMKALPSDDPRNFLQQANIHCAYCDGAYDEIAPFQLQVHNSWLFFPWHRLYLHFHERILGKLVGDDTFAIPFWNWDTPQGMTLPAIYAETSSPLYNPNRNVAHQRPATVDFDFGEADDPESPTQEQLIDQNLKLMHKQVILSGSTARTFLGQPYRSGKKPEPGGGVLEHIPHGTVHRWTGDPRRELNGDMGVFALAARDPIFYAHHANIDRVWSVWKTLGGKRRDFVDDPDWLESSFLFYDENKQLVRVKVKDCLQTETLGYQYQDVANPWLRTRPTRKAAVTPTHKSNLNAKKTRTGTTPFPFTLSSSPVTVAVKRPKVSRSQTDKEEEEEVLVIENIEFTKDHYIKFDAYINTLEHSEVGPESSEHAGCFVSLPHKHDHRHDKKATSKLSLGINELLKDLEAEDDESLLVTLVPRSGKVEIGGIKIEFDN